MTTLLASLSISLSLLSPVLFVTTLVVVVLGLGRLAMARKLSAALMEAGEELSSELSELSGLSVPSVPSVPSVFLAMSVSESSASALRSEREPEPEPEREPEPESADAVGPALASEPVALVEPGVPSVITRSVAQYLDESERTLRRLTKPRRPPEPPASVSPADSAAQTLAVERIYLDVGDYSECSAPR